MVTYDVDLEFIGSLDNENWIRKMKYKISDEQVAANDGFFYTKQMKQDWNKDCINYFSNKLGIDPTEIEYTGGGAFVKNISPKSWSEFFKAIYSSEARNTVKVPYKITASFLSH